MRGGPGGVPSSEDDPKKEEARPMRLISDPHRDPCGRTNDLADPRPDEALLADYGRTRDARALDALVRRHWAEAFRLALRALGDPAAAEDAAQEAFVGLVRAAPRWRPGPFAPWLRALVMNAVRNALRARGRRRRHEDRVAQARAGAVPAEG